VVQATFTNWFCAMFLLERRWDVLRIWLAFRVALAALLVGPLVGPLVGANLRLLLHRQWRHLPSRGELGFTWAIASFSLGVALGSVSWVAARASG
jgi:hypothetical protein